MFHVGQLTRDTISCSKARVSTRNLEGCMLVTMRRVKKTSEGKKRIKFLNIGKCSPF